MMEKLQSWTKLVGAFACASVSRVNLKFLNTKMVPLCPAINVPAIGVNIAYSSKAFGLVQPTLIQQIKKILDQYPDDGQILKELIQNAEDAGAKEVRFLYDKHSHGTKKLCNPRLAKFQGPALYAYNDAKFTDDDWDGIGMLCNSIKAEDPTKVGRFGLGFKSVFHMTDLPSVISGDSVGIIDPEEKYFSDDDGKRSGRKWHLRQDRQDIRKNSDQFAPYKGIFGCNDETFKRGSYEGTLFRLPLRKETSKLSDTIYSQEKMRGLLECFEKDAHLILLFLMNLERIEVYEREQGCSQPRKLFYVGIAADCLKEVRKAREEFIAKVQDNASYLLSGPFPEVKKTYALTIETVFYNNGGVNRMAEHSYVVTLFFSGSDVSREIKALMTNDSLSYLPLVGVALPLQPQNACKEEDGYMNYHRDNDYEESDGIYNTYDGDDIVVGDGEPQGHIFCFLPLPLEDKSLSGLPVHVNGFFALSQNRRHLKWPSADQDETLTDKSLLWNKGLLQEVLPKAYSELILHVISCSSRDEQRRRVTTSDVYSAWPDINKVDVKWKSVLWPLFDILLQYEVLHTDDDGGWCRVEEVLLDNLKKSDQSREIVIELLNKTGRKVVTVPAHVETALQQYCILQYVTPKILRSSLKADPSCYAHLNHQDKILLLKFVLSDSDFPDVHGMVLLPLADKTFTAFGGRMDASIYIDSTEHPKSLLPGLQRMFLDTEVDDAVKEQLTRAVKKGYTQLCLFDKEAVKQHLRQSLPSDWQGSEIHVTWCPGISRQLTIEWFRTLWKYFGRHFSPFDLDSFVGLPLVPVTPMSNQSEVQLARIQRPSSLVLASFNGESIDELVCHVLKNLGLTILQDLPDYIRYYPKLVPNFTNPPSPKGVLNAVGVIIKSPQGKSAFLQRMRGLPAKSVRSFRRFLSSISWPMTNIDFNLLQILPLFEIYPGGRESQFVSVKKVNIGAPIDSLPPVSIFTELLDLRDHSSSVLAQLLNIKPLSHNDLLKIMLDDALKNKYRQSELDELVKYTLDRFGIFRGEYFNTIKHQLQNLSFVLSGGNSRKKPSELYDPEQILLKQVFYGEDIFPKEQSYYSHSDVLSQLRKLGLKGTESVTASDILRSAKLQASKKSIKGDTAKVKSLAILKLLEHKPLLLQDKVKSGPRIMKLKECLCSIPWIPIVTEKPASYPIHLSLKQIDHGKFACPKDVTSHQYINLVGSVKLLVDTGHIPRVSQCFKWHQEPAILDVISHLYNVTGTFQEGINLDERSIRKVLEKMYEYFQKALSEFGRDVVKELLSPVDFILVHEHLCPAKKLAFSSNVTYPPYLMQLPDSYQYRFGELFKAVGVRQSFGIGDYIKTLQMVKDKYGRNPVTEELAQVKSVLNSLAQVMVKEEVNAKEAIDEYGSICIPDSDDIMKPSVNVCVKDCYWMPSEPDVSYINEGVSPQVCITLGAKTIRQNTLGKHVIPLGTPFGQKEKLTNRLKRILEGYPCDESIMKELLQNADDAKATKVCFINDPRQHPDERVFEESWKPLQGPALCVYNNAPFTESDIQGIQNLGEGNKGDDPNKTGQYGVGFNAVYHLTDAPTFISQGEEIGEVMCVFDPNLKFVPDADASNPGMMYTEIPTLWNKFPDVFSCYDLQQYFPLTNATMFRLPLRNKEMARTSKISNNAMTIRKLEELLDNFKNELLQVLLFVKNVNDVSICEIDKETGELSESYRVQTSLSPEDEQKRTKFSTYGIRVGESLRNKGGISVTKIPLEKVSYVVELKDSKGLKQKWLVVQQIGFENPEKIPGNIEEAFERGDLGLLPRGGVASLISSSEGHQDVQGKAFCFLPLPFETGLPVHVNGHFALNHEDRRSLWRDNKSDYRSNWNEGLLQQVVAPCYLTLLDRVRQHIWLSRIAGKTYLKADLETGKYVLLNYYKLFPTLEAQERYWKTLSKEVYRLMDEKVLRLLPVLRQESKEILKIEWLPPTGKGRDQPYFDNLVEVFEQDKKPRGDARRNIAQEKEELLRSTLLALSFNLLCMPISIYRFFKSSGVNVKLISPTDVISFFQTYKAKEQRCNVVSLPLHIKDTQFKSIHSFLEVVKYCKREETFLQRLEGLPLLLTEDEVLRVFSQSHKVFLSRYYELLPNCRSVFLHHNLHLTFSCDSALVPVFAVFDIAAFARLLPYELDQEKYETANICVNWCPEKQEDDIPNTQWIRQVWKFFSYHIAKVIQSNEEWQSSQRRPIPQMTYSEEKQMEEEKEKRNKEAKKRIIQEKLDPVKNWCLLPAFRVHHYFSFSQVEYTLAPIAMSESVIILESLKSFSLLKETLMKMFLPRLNCRLIDGGYSEGASKMVRQLVATLDDPQSVLILFIRRFHSDPNLFEVLQAEDCSIVLRYFNDHLAQLESSSAKELKRLPLYATIHNTVISISEKDVFVLSPRIPKEDMDIWEETAGIVFLKRSGDLERLYKFLQCHYEDEVDVYLDVIFESFEEMSENARLKHMAFVRELMKELNNVPSYLSDKTIEEKKRKLLRLTTALSEVQFIAAQDGTLKTASSFYDPSNEVFKTMFERKREMFPPKPFCEWEWLSFLRQIGLIHEVSNEQFVQFTKEVETEAQTSPDDGTRKKSEALVSYLFESEDIASSMVLDYVKDICFIFPYVVHPRLLAIHQQYGPGNTCSPCICFRGSVASKNHDIAWTTANFLPDNANPFYHANLDLTHQEQNQIAQRLGIFPTPTIEMVVAHCKNICNVLYHMNDTESSPRREIRRVFQQVIIIMKSIYENLEDNYEDNEEAINVLKDVPCIVVCEGKRFVFPCQVAVDITSQQEIPPYLYKIPLEVATYEKLFKNLGTTNTITAAQYFMVLKSIHDESGKKKLHPNEIRNAFKATRGFFETFDKDDVQVTGFTPLYLPGVKQNPSDPSLNMVFLRKSGEILYNDAPHLKERLRKFNELILVKLADCGLQVNNEDLVVQKLPKSVRPRMLTSVVRETLMYEDLQHVTCSSTAQELRHVLTSSEFCNGIIRLIKHADYQSNAETSTDIPPLVEERLRCIHVYSVPNLRTRLVYNGKAIPESEAEVCCFEEETEEENKRVWKIYIEKDAELSNFDSVLAEIIDRITGNYLKKMIVHLPKLLSTKPYEMKRLLDGLKIREDNSELQIKACFLPTPGNFIHISDHHLLVDDFTVFSPGEYVGYELDDPSLRGEDGTPTYIYAVVIEEVIEDGQPSNLDPSLRKYRIDIGKDKEPIVVDAADLYKFYRPSRGNSECLELEEFTGIPYEKKPENLDEIRKEIRRILKEAWKLSEERRKKIIKRLFLKWHPDKNAGNEAFCTEIFNFILEEIERLKQLNQADYFDDTVFGYWGYRAQCHGSQRSSFYSGGGIGTSYRSNPQPGEARRWYKQAKADLEAASNDVQYQRTSYEWACFKCHQSAEKALKAAQYSIDADKTNVHNLGMIALDLNNATLSRLASELESLVGDSTRMRYPDRLRYPEIPNCVYTSPMASEAIRLSAAIVQEVESKFINRAG